MHAIPQVPRAAASDACRSTIIMPKTLTRRATQTQTAASNGGRGRMELQYPGAKLKLVREQVVVWADTMEKKRRLRARKRARAAALFEAIFSRFRKRVEELASFARS
ncbi:hypothetical protein Ancab_014970 [Ancistrocladus abbreviatus]